MAGVNGVNLPRYEVYHTTGGENATFSGTSYATLNSLPSNLSLDFIETQVGDVLIIILTACFTLSAADLIGYVSYDVNVTGFLQGLFSGAADTKSASNGGKSLAVNIGGTSHIEIMTINTPNTSYGFTGKYRIRGSGTMTLNKHELTVIRITYSEVTQ